MNKICTLRRIMNEIGQIKQHKSADADMFNLEQMGNNIFHWQADLYGPKDSPYEDYIFKIDIKLPDNYPTLPPTVKFVTRIEHANINSKGDICMDILKPNDWASTLGMRSVLISILSLLSTPNLEDPLNSDLVGLRRTNEKEYNIKIRNACRKYAGKKNAKN